MLDGLGLSALPRGRRTSELSGVERARLSLAWLLLCRPDIMLLDEPTNHLDDSANEHLREVLSDWAGPVLLASHDRAFLDEAVNSLLDLNPAPLPQAVSGPQVGDGTGSGIGVTRCRHVHRLPHRATGRPRALGAAIPGRTGRAQTSRRIGAREPER